MIIKLLALVITVVMVVAAIKLRDTGPIPVSPCATLHPAFHFEH